jgi:hypothetical protein
MYFNTDVAAYNLILKAENCHQNQSINIPLPPHIMLQQWMKIYIEKHAE